MERKLTRRERVLIWLTNKLDEWQFKISEREWKKLERQN